MAIKYVVNGEMNAQGMKIRQSDWTRLALGDHDVQLDMTNVRDLDPSGLGAILFLYKRLAAARKRFEILNASGQPLEFLTKFNAVGLMAARPAPARRAPLYARPALRAAIKRIDQSA